MDKTALKMSGDYVIKPPGFHGCAVSWGIGRFWQSKTDQLGHAGFKSEGSDFVINSRAFFQELLGFFFHAFSQGFFFLYAFFIGVISYILTDFHRAEVRAAHRAKVRDFG
jgi:hypothetical protein